MFPSWTSYSHSMSLSSVLHRACILGSLQKAKEIWTCLGTIISPSCYPNCSPEFSAFVLPQLLLVNEYSTFHVLLLANPGIGIVPTNIQGDWGGSSSRCNFKYSSSTNEIRCDWREVCGCMSSLASKFGVVWRRLHGDWHLGLLCLIVKIYERCFQHVNQLHVIFFAWIASFHHAQIRSSRSSSGHRWACLLAGCSVWAV